ncbi:MAG: hypothetical protein ACK5MV_00895 [Aminipila sp.]
MKINGSYFTTPIEKKNTQKQTRVETPNFKSHLQNMDSITISASRDQIADAQFLSSLRGKISSEVKAEHSSEELNTLSEQISKGEYEIGATDIAKKLLLMDFEK